MRAKMAARRGRIIFTCAENQWPFEVLRRTHGEMALADLKESGAALSWEAFLETLLETALPAGTA